LGFVTLFYSRIATLTKYEGQKRRFGGANLMTETQRVDDDSVTKAVTATEDS